MHQRDVEPEKDMKSRELSADKLTDLSSDQLQALHISQSLLTRVEQASGPLQPTEQAVRAWCDFAIAQANSDIERLSRAAVAYSAIPPNPLQVGAGSDTNDIGLQMLTLYAAGFCYLLADKPDLAEPLFRRCIDASPGGPKFRRRLTECLIRQGKKSEAVEAFAEYDRLQVGPADERWLSPLVLELGFEWKRWTPSFGQGFVTAKVESGSRFKLPRLLAFE